MWRLITILTFFIFPFFGTGQQLSYTNYSAEQGLSSNTVYASLQDNKGYLWFATETGLCRFDGVYFKTYSFKSGLTDNTVLKLHEDKNGTLWVVTLSGKVFRLFDEKLVPLPFPVTFSKATVRDITSDKNGYLLFATAEYGLIKLFENKFTPISEMNPGNDPKRVPVSFSDSQKDKQWVLGSKYLAELNGTKIKTYKIPENISYASEGSICAVNDTLILYAKTGKLYQFNSLTQKHNFIDVVEDKIIYSIQYSHGMVRLATNKGMVWLSPHLKIIQTQFENCIITFCTKDREGNLWVSTLNEGVFFVPSENIFNFKNHPLLTGEKFTHLLTDKQGTLWAGTENGYIYYYQGNNWTNIPTPSGMMKKNRISAMVSSGDSVIVAKNDIILVISYKEKKILSQIEMPRHYSIKAIAPFKDKLYIGTHRGLFLQTKDTVISTPFTERVTTVQVENDGTIWCYNGRSLNSYHKGKLVNWGDKSPSLKVRSYCMTFSTDNTLWIATQGAGLVYICKSVVNSISSANGLLSDICTAVYVNPENGEIWAATNKGLNRIPFDNGKLTEIQSYTRRHGLPSNQINNVLVKNDTAWIATNRGISFFKIDNLRSNNIPPPIYIDQIKISDVPMKLRIKYELAYNENNVILKFTGLAFRNAGSIRYRYKMVGIDKNWNYTTSNLVQYPNLEPGEYTFEVGAQNEDGVWSSKNASVKFIISPPWWLTGWFKLLMVVVALLVLVFVYELRVKYIKRKEKEKTEYNKRIAQLEMSALRAQMNPHFIFNCLNSIQNFINKGDEENANTYLNKFADLLRMILEHSRLSEISLEQELVALQLYVDLENLRFDSKIEFEVIKNEIDISDIKVPPLLFQPFVENAIKHGMVNKTEEGKITLVLTRKNDILYCRITDNGIGRKNASAKKLSENKSFGLQITQERINTHYKDIAASLDFEISDLYDEAGKATGTEVMIRIPLSHE